MPSWMKHKLESRLPEEISITSDMQMTLPLWQKAKRNWGASWWKWKESEKAGLKLRIQGGRFKREGIYVYLWLIHVELWQKTEKFCKAIILQLKKKKNTKKLNIQKTKIMASSPLISWQIDGQTMETVADFILRGSKISADDDWSYVNKRCLLVWRKPMTNLDSICKSRDITLLK